MTQLAPGFYGKIPMTGDFIHRRIPPVFLNRWDEWLKRNIAQSQYTLGDNWLDIYLTSPMWRFMLAPGIIDEHSYCGVMIPSVDSVGRYFPLTLVQKVPNAAAAFILSEAANQWFQQLEDILLDMLEGYHTDTNDFDEKLKQATANWIQQTPSENTINLQHLSQSGGHFKWDVQGADSFNQSLSALLLSSLMNSQTAYSLWWQQSANDDNSSCLYATGLPASTQFTALFDNSWQEHGWQPLQLASPKVTQPQPEETYTAPQPAAVAVPPPAQAEDSATLDDLLDITAPAPRDDRTQPAARYDEEWTASVQYKGFDGHDQEDVTVSPTISATLSSVNRQKDRVPHQTPPAAVSNRVRQSTGFTDTGNYREKNEDALLLKPSAGLWVVADGMGGHEDGAYASQAVVDALRQIDMGDSMEHVLSRIKISLDNVNQQLLAYAENQATQGVCGSTVIGLVIRHQQCAFFWAGDSRLYLYRDQQLQALSKDHSFEQEQIDQGIISADTPNFSGKNLITRAVGGDQTLALDICYHNLQPGDQFFLCSDGVYNEISLGEIEGIIAEADDLEAASERLQQTVSAGTAKDNFTAIFVGKE